MRFGVSFFCAFGIVAGIVWPTSVGSWLLVGSAALLLAVAYYERWRRLLEGAKRDPAYGVPKRRVPELAQLGQPMEARLRLDGQWRRGFLVMGEEALRFVGATGDGNWRNWVVDRGAVAVGRPRSPSWRETLFHLLPAAMVVVPLQAPATGLVAVWSAAADEIARWSAPRNQPHEGCA